MSTPRLHRGSRRAISAMAAQWHVSRKMRTRATTSKFLFSSRSRRRCCLVKAHGRHLPQGGYGPAPQGSPARRDNLAGYTTPSVYPSNPSGYFFLAQLFVVLLDKLTIAAGEILCGAIAGCALGPPGASCPILAWADRRHAAQGPNFAFATGQHRAVCRRVGLAVAARPAALATAALLPALLLALFRLLNKLLEQLDGPLLLDLHGFAGLAGAQPAAGVDHQV